MADETKDPREAVLFAACVNGDSEIPNILADLDAADPIRRMWPEVVEALERVGDRRMWRYAGGELVWRGMSSDGNEIEVESPLDILGDLLTRARAITPRSPPMTNEQVGAIRCTCEWSHPVDGRVQSDWPAELDPSCPVHSQDAESVEGDLPDIDGNGRDLIRNLFRRFGINDPGDAMDWLAEGLREHIVCPTRPDADPLDGALCETCPEGIDKDAVVEVNMCEDCYNSLVPDETPPHTEPGEGVEGEAAPYGGSWRAHAEASDGCLLMIRDELVRHLGEDALRRTPPMMYPEAIRQAIGEARAQHRRVGREEIERAFRDYADGTCTCVDTLADEIGMKITPEEGDDG